MIPIGYIGETTHRLELQEIPEDEAVTEPSPETAPAEALTADALAEEMVARRNQSRLLLTQ